MLLLLNSLNNLFLLSQARRRLPQLARLRPGGAGTGRARAARRRGLQATARRARRTARSWTRRAALQRGTLEAALTLCHDAVARLLRRPRALGLLEAGWTW